MVLEQITNRRKAGAGRATGPAGPPAQAEQISTIPMADEHPFIQAHRAYPATHPSHPMHPAQLAPIMHGHLEKWSNPAREHIISNMSSKSGAGLWPHPSKIHDSPLIRAPHLWKGFNAITKKARRSI